MGIPQIKGLCYSKNDDGRDLRRSPLWTVDRTLFLRPLLQPPLGDGVEVSVRLMNRRFVAKRSTFFY